MKTKGFYIPSVDAKDLYLAMHPTPADPAGYTLYQAPGEYRIKKFSNSLDYSLDLLKLQELYFKKYRNRHFGFQENGKSYTTQVINVTFRYSVKSWNQTNRNTFVKLGYHQKTLTFTDGIAKNADGQVAGIIVQEPLQNPLPKEQLPEFFSVTAVPICDPDTGETRTCLQYQKEKEPDTVITGAGLRTFLYENGFLCDGVHYVRMKRSSGSARVGKCLFVNEALFPGMQKFGLGGIRIRQGQEIDLAALESYIALPSSSILDVISIKPENILILKDYESTFQEEVIATISENGRLKTRRQTVEITNSIWDGQSLLDTSLFGAYASYGMLLLRNLMFKSCCFQCRIQQWFADHGITEVSQLNGYTLAASVSDIKLITTESSIKYLKFSTKEQWLKHLYPQFGIVKHDKKTHFFEGQLVQTHYQLLNTLQLSKEEMAAFLKPSLDFAQLLRNDPDVVRYYIQYPDTDEMDPFHQPVLTKNDVVYHLMCVNERFTDTRYYQEFLHDLLAAFYKNLKNGHVLVHGNYSVLFGNPIEMLQQAIGAFTGESQIGKGNIHSRRFPYRQTLLGSRSPHVTIGNVWLPYNAENPEIDAYFPLTEEIVCINSIGENVLQRLSGADFDSDTVMLTDNAILLHAARRNYDTFLTPTSLVKARKVRRCYTPAEQADLDVKTSVNLIGEIINLSQELNTMLWHRIHGGASYEDVEELYFDICQLDIMSGIEIDKAKKEFDIDNRQELSAIRKKYQEVLTTEDGKKIMPHFFAHIARQKGYYDPEKKSYQKQDTSMDYLQTIVNSFKVRNPYKKDYLPLASILDRSKYRTSDVNQKQINRIYSLLKQFMKDSRAVCHGDSDKESRKEQLKLLKDNLTAAVRAERMGFSTLFCLLASSEKKENSSIKKLLLEILFACRQEDFQKAILESREDLEQLEMGDGAMSIYGIPFKKYKKSEQFRNPA